MGGGVCSQQACVTLATHRALGLHSLSVKQEQNVHSQRSRVLPRRAQPAPRAWRRACRALCGGPAASARSFRDLDPALVTERQDELGCPEEPSRDSRHRRASEARSPRARHSDGVGFHFRGLSGVGKLVE